MNNKIKTYKIIFDSKLFANIRGSTPAEVAKKAASKILGNSLNRTHFSIVEVKTGKIRHYDAKRENLIRPYHKNGKLITFRIVVKKLGKQVGGTYPPNLREDSVDPIFDFFPRGEYEIEIIKRFRKDCVNIKNCILFYIKDNILYLEYIKKCQSSGKINLEKIIDYAKIMKLESIKLADSSEISSGISMPIIFILANGISWYNQYGFISGEENFIEEKKHNLELMNLTLNNFLSKISNKISNKNNNNNNIGKFIQLINKYGFDINSKVKDIFKKIKELLKNNLLNKYEIDILKKILFFIQLSSIIFYNPELTKIL
jgi:hypothetical protein